MELKTKLILYDSDRVIKIVDKKRLQLFLFCLLVILPIFVYDVVAVTLSAGTIISPNVSGGYNGNYTVETDVEIDELLVGQNAYVAKGLSGLIVTNRNTSSVIGIGNNVTIPPINNTNYILNISDYYSGNSWGIKVYFNGTSGHPNMTSGIKYIDYTYEDSSYLTTQAQQNTASSAFIIVILGTMVFAFFAITGGIETGIVAGSITLLIAGGVIIPIIGAQVRQTREYTEVFDEQINFQYNDTYYQTQHHPIKSIVGIYNDSSHSGKYESSQYDFINSGSGGYG